MDICRRNLLSYLTIMAKLKFQRLCGMSSELEGWISEAETTLWGRHQLRELGDTVLKAKSNFWFVLPTTLNAPGALTGLKPSTGTH